MIKLVLCDMDLTLVPRPHQTVTSLGLAAIHDLLDQGVYVGAASGRGIPDLRVQFAGDEACVRTAVASNGCEVMADGELICHNPLPREELEAALASCARCERELKSGSDAETAFVRLVVSICRG